MPSNLQKKITEDYELLVRPELGRMLSLLKLDIHYERAVGDELTYTTADGECRKVIDFLGGYGSTILGHNHPAILREMVALIETQIPVHAQASLRSGSVKLSRKLNQMIQHETNEARSFVMTTANSGAEAVEVAIKHALLQWKNKKESIILEIEKTLLKIENETHRKLFLQKKKALEDVQPKLLSLKRSFHGKTSSALFATANADYRKMFSKGPFATEFLDVDAETDLLRKQLVAEDISLQKPDGHPFFFSPYFAFIFEPIQGEGGIHLLPKSFFAELTSFFHDRLIPLVADEIQSGLFRTGNFLASTLLGVKPDYILLGKSLGGGLVKAACALIAKNHYQDEFGWLHTSTNAEDDWTCAIAEKTLNLLTEFKPVILEKAEAFEKHMLQLGEEINREYPGVIKLVKGKGFFIGMEFNFDLDYAIPSILRGFQYSGQVSYLFTSYLLHHHNLRIGVTLSSPETLRFEPSAFVTKESLIALRLGLKDLCHLLHERKIGKLIEHLWLEQPSATITEKPSKAEPIPRKLTGSKLTRVGFLSHIINFETLRTMDASIAGVSETDFRRLFKLNLNQTAPFCYHQQELRGATGEPIILNVYGLFIPSYQFEEDLRKQTNLTLKKVQDAVDLATEEGCSYFGLGQYTSIVSGNGQLLKTRIPITTGNSLTAGMAVRALAQFLNEKSKQQENLRIGVVGFTGNIGHVVSQLLGDLGYPMTLIHREPYSESPRFQAAVESLLANSKIQREQITCTHQIEALHDCDAVLIGTNSSQQFIRATHLKPGAAVLDISVPSNLHPEVRNDKSFTAFQGGFVRFPYEQVPGHHWIPAAGTKNWFACMGETILCGLHGERNPFSIGSLVKSSVLGALEMADTMQVTLGDLRKEL